MRFDYYGKNPNTGRQKPEVCITYSSDKEADLAEYLFEYLENMGYVVAIEEGIATIEVESKEDFHKIMAIHMDIKE